MDKMSKIMMIVTAIVFIAFAIHIYNIIPIRQEEQKNELEDKSINNDIINKYLLDTYGNIKELFIINYIGKNTGEEIRGMYVRSWVRAYQIITPFMSKPFEVWIDNRTHKVFGDNFYEVLSTDEKFQHLYSDWVKKQIGCEDENVELKFANYNTNEKLNIDFVNIKNISTNYDEIFKNLYNYYLIEIHRKNIKDLSNINYKQYADEINNKYFKKIENITGKSKIEHYVELYNNNVNLLDINYHTFGKTDYSKIDMHYEVEYE